jgi:hypothetical protein
MKAATSPTNRPRSSASTMLRARFGLLAPRGTSASTRISPGSIGAELRLVRCASRVAIAAALAAGFCCAVPWRSSIRALITVTVSLTRRSARSRENCRYAFAKACAP